MTSRFLEFGDLDLLLVELPWESLLLFEALDELRSGTGDGRCGEIGTEAGAAGTGATVVVVVSMPASASSPTLFSSPSSEPVC